MGEVGLLDEWVIDLKRMNDLENERMNECMNEWTMGLHMNILS